MAREGTSENSAASSSDIATMVSLISELGPRIPEIARRMGRHKETVRYWYKKLQEHDFAISGILNHEALGLKRIVMKVRFGDGFTDFVRPLMIAMNEICYVVAYSKGLPEDIYVLSASVPEEFAAEYVDFIETLRNLGVFKSVEHYMLDWISNKPMQGNFYNFDSGVWDIDFQTLYADSAKKPYTEPVRSGRVKFDRIDLLLAKELQRDATRELQEIQASIKQTDGVDINYKTMCWHLSEHVEPRLLKGYKINWIGTKYDPVTERVGQRSHAYLGVDILIKSVRPQERAEVLGRLDALPVTWAIGAGSDIYGQVMIPVRSVVEGLEYLQTAVARVSDRATFVMDDQRNALSFTISYKLYDEVTKNWSFDREELLAKFKALDVRIR